jgi:hypothetical protein
MEDDVDMHGPYIGLELSEDVKTTRTEALQAMEMLLCARIW